MFPARDKREQVNASVIGQGGEVGDLFVATVVDPTLAADLAMWHLHVSHGILMCKSLSSDFLIDWLSGSLSQGHTNLQSLVKCLDHSLIFECHFGVSLLVCNRTACNQHLLELVLKYHIGSLSPVLMLMLVSLYDGVILSALLKDIAVVACLTGMSHGMHGHMTILLAGS